MQLANHYWLLRHGRSRANEAGLIVSNVRDGTGGKYGLAAAGVSQARAAG
jgi:broad specificity phosphatase PhoE